MAGKKTAAKKTAAKVKVTATEKKALAGKHSRSRDKRKSYARLVKKYGRTVASQIVKMANAMEAKATKKTTSARKTTSKRKTTSARKTTSSRKKKTVSKGRAAQAKKMDSKNKREASAELKKRQAALVKACKAHFKNAKTKTIKGKKVSPYAQWVKKVGNLRLAAMVYKKCGMKSK